MSTSPHHTAYCHEVSQTTAAIGPEFQNKGFRVSLHLVCNQRPAGDHCALCFPLGGEPGFDHQVDRIVASAIFSGYHAVCNLRMEKMDDDTGYFEAYFT